jgi:hypothetical protein
MQRRRGRVVGVEREAARVQLAQHPSRAFGLRLGHAQPGATHRQPPLPVRHRHAVVGHVRIDAFGAQAAAGDMRLDRVGIAGDGGEQCSRRRRRGDGRWSTLRP